MDRPSFIEVFGYLLKFIVVIFTVFFLVNLLLSNDAFVEMHQLEKFTVELKESLLVGDLTTERLVLSTDALQEHSEEIYEPIRTCKYIYFIEIRCLDKDLCESYGINEKYELGSKYVRTETMSYGVPTPKKISVFPVLVESASGRAPASMTITVSDDPLSRLSCIIEKAYRTRTIQSETCIIRSSKGDCQLKASASIALRKTGDAICDVLKDDEYGTLEDMECKYLPGVQLADFLYPLDTDFSGKKYLKAVPARADAVPETYECPDNIEGLVAPVGEDATVFICGDDEA
jgi:hypothetical protein